MIGYVSNEFNEENDADLTHSSKILGYLLLYLTCVKAHFGGMGGSSKNKVLLYN